MNISNFANRQTNIDKKLVLKGRIILAVIAILILFVTYKIMIPEIINIPVQKGYKACYETIEENLSDHDNLEILTAYCYRTKSLEANKILSSYSYSNSSDNLPDIDYIYKFNFESDNTIGLKISVYCGYNNDTKNVVFFGTDDTYYVLEKNHSTTGEYGSYRKVINSKFLSDVIEFLY